MPKINLFNSSGKDSKDSISASELVNLLPRVSSDKAGGGVTFAPFPGMGGTAEDSTDSSDEYMEIYGMTAYSETFENRIYIVNYDASAAIYRMLVFYYDSVGGTTTITTIGTMTGASGNFSNITHDASKHGGKTIVADRDANKIWVVTMDNDPVSDAIATYTMPTGWALQTIDYQDGFFIGNIKDTSANDEQRKFVASDFGATTFTSTSFGLLTSAAGNIVAIESDKREAWLYCDDHIEPWYNAGGEGFTFIRNPSVYIDVGLYSRDSVQRIKGGSFFLGHTLKGGIGIYRIDGYTEREITPPELKTLLSSGLYGAEAKFSYSKSLKITESHLYIINFYNANLGTWAYDINSELWTKTKSTGLEWDQYIRGSTYVQMRLSAGGIYGFYVVIPYNTFTLVDNGVRNFTVLHIYDQDEYRLLSRDTALTATNLERAAISDHIYGDENKNLIHRRLVLEFVPSSADIGLSWSDDDGATYTTPETISLTGGIIDRRALGSSRDRIYKITSTSNADTTLINAWIDVEELAH